MMAVLDKPFNLFSMSSRIKKKKIKHKLSNFDL